MDAIVRTTSLFVMEVKIGRCVKCQLWYSEIVTRSCTVYLSWGYEYGKLAAVESILGSSISAIDTKTEQEKLTLDAKNKAKKLFGDAKERKDAKKKEKKGMVDTLKIFFLALK